MVGVLGPLLKVISCIDISLDFLRIMGELRELRHCGPPATNWFMVIVGCILSKFSRISQGVRSLDNAIILDDFGNCGITLQPLVSRI